MRFLFQPGILLMGRFSLLPKFTVVALLLAIPALLVTSLLAVELNKSIELAQQEQSGVRALRTLQQLHHGIQEHRAWQHLALAGNVQAKEKKTNLEPGIEQAILALSSQQITTPSFDPSKEIVDISSLWKSLKDKSEGVKARDVYQLHSELLVRLEKLRVRIADNKHLSLDPQVDTYYLISLFYKTIPELSAAIADTASQGAPYIDTGLLEANEDVLINVNVLLTQRDLPKVKAQIQSAVEVDPQLKALLEQEIKLFDQNQAFLERTKSEVLNTLNQSSGTAYLESGLQTINGWRNLNDTIASTLENKFNARLASLQWNRNAMLLLIVLMLVVASYLLASFYFSFSHQVRSLSQAASQISHGDLSQIVKTTGKDELAQLQTEFEGMRLVLAKLVEEIRGGTGSITIAAQEIAAGNADLSSRTEQQAHSLGETSSSMEQLTTTVQQNTQSAQEANQQAKNATLIAKQGGDMVSQLVNMMEAIQVSSQRINDIIGVIDGIAFQTNILALNAAVEAARAGEQGRGFAVVASEVRSLAQRSAEAAKEIKGLITTSVEQVKAGNRQVHATGETMRKIVLSIDAVSDNMQQISHASVEQGDGIRMVNATLGQLDSITQQNAALVEEAAAAAESMHQQAQSLAEAVSIFVLAEMDTNAPVTTDRSNMREPLQLKGKTRRTTKVSNANKRNKNLLSLAK